MGVAMFAEFNHDPAAAHFVGDGAGGAGAGEGVEDEVAGVGGDGEYSMNNSFGLWGLKKIGSKDIGKDFL